MALHWRPVGPEPAPTYWQRRAVVMVAVLLLLLFLRAVLTGAGGADDRVTATPSTPQPSPSAGAAASAGPSGSPLPSPSPSSTPCAPPALTATATTERDGYPVGGRPVLVLTVTNTGPTPCTRDLGQGAVELLVVSGADRIFSSDDCAPGGPAKPVVLAPGEKSVTRLTWAGRRSQPGCTGDKAEAQAGTYRVSARLGDLQVPGSAFVLE